MKQKTLDTFQLESTDPKRFVRITILYSPLRAMRSRKHLSTAFIRLGNMVVTIANFQLQDDVQSMLRDMLIPIAACRRFLDIRRPVHSRGILRIMEQRRMKNIIKRLKTLPTTKLVDECLILMDALSVFLPPFRFNLLYSHDVIRIANQMTFSALYGIDCYRSYAQRMSERTQKGGTRPVES